LEGGVGPRCRGDQLDAFCPYSGHKPSGLIKPDGLTTL
jgi:hypothetical protein